MRGTACIRRSPEPRTARRSFCEIFATLGKYFEPVTLADGFSVPMSPTYNTWGRPHEHRIVDIDSGSYLRRRFRSRPFGFAAKALGRALKASSVDQQNLSAHRCGGRLRRVTHHALIA